MSKVLVLDAESAAGLECVQSLGRTGARVCVASPAKSALAFGSTYCSERQDQPSHPDEILAWTAALDARHGFDLIIPSTERSLLAFAKGECDAELYRKAVLPHRASLQRATNKESIWHLAATLEIPVPPSVLASSASIPALPFGFPVAVKPVQSKAISGGRMLDLRVAYAADPEELAAALSAAPGLSYQVQKLVRGYGVGIELLFAHGEPVLHFSHERVHELPLTGGGSSYRKAIKAPARLLAQSIALLEALEWHGVAMVEWKVDPEAGPMLMEINPRLWGSLALAIDAGVDFPQGLLAVAQGKEAGPQRAYRVPYYTRDLTRDLDWQLANLRADRANPQLLVQPRLRSMMELLRPLAFRESWDFFDFADLGVTGRRIADYAGIKCSAVMAKVKKRYRSRQFVRSTHRRLLAKVEASPESHRRVLFLCYGNICRSPLAACMAARALPGHTIRSAGFHTVADRSSPLHMQAAAAGFGVDMGAHRSQVVTADEIASAGLVLVMDWKNYTQLMQTFPQAKSKTTFLGLFSAGHRLEIEDPYELQGERLQAVIRCIAESIEGLSEKLSL